MQKINYSHDNELIAKKAFDNGTYLYLEKSLDETIVKNLWQFVSRKKIQKEKMRDGLDPKGDHVKYVDNIGNENIVGNIEQVGEKSMSINNEEQRNNTHETENNVVSRRTNNLRSKRCNKRKKCD
ncbi:hypothetical protein H5410_022508 [Solanum commersonii]|uniref:Uncharacterized protein n=1 Tax=Solanum commersonii TaxID=4109 RepID=A0A9J5ZE71_SOLCO|nr:hypothetical protein H5410_022508 [Solanum commersonii]